MTMTKEQFNLAKMRTKHEKMVLFNNVLNIRHRSYGLVDLVDVVPSSWSQSSQCSPVQKEATDIDVTSWFDSTSLNLMYVCARTMLLDEVTKDVSMDVANFTLDFHSNR